MTHPVPLARHRARLPRRAFVAVGVAVLAAVLTVTAVRVAAGGRDGVLEGSSIAMAAVANPPTVDALPVPVTTAAPVSVQVCNLPTVIEALANGDDEGVVAAAGGGAVLRAAIVAGKAPCVDLAEPGDVWFVVNKLRPFPQADWAPNDLVEPQDVRVLDGSYLSNKAAVALGQLEAALEADGVGEVAVASGYRSYSTQVANHAGQVSAQGRAAELSSARAGFSEHQTGLTADLVACDGSSCGSLDAFGDTDQGRWVAENGWQYGWIVRYEAGRTGVTGYEPEPWHLRYIGPDLARAYHDGGFHTLEEFFALPAAPDYAD